MIKPIPRAGADTEQLARLQIQADAIADDFFDYSRVVVRKPWGYEYLIFSNDTVAVWVLYLKPSAQTSMHCHPGKKTSLVVLEGRVECSTLSARVEREAGDGLLLEKGVFHQTRVLSEGGAFVMETETPVNKRDLVRLADKYGREGMGYESSDSHSVNLQNYNTISFTGVEVYHNLKKRVGECTLAFKRLAGAAMAADILMLDDDDVVTILRGALVDAAGSAAADVGDTVTVASLRARPGLRAQGATDLLTTSRIDRIVKISDVVADFIRAQGVRDVFLVPGDSNVHLLDSIGRKEGLQFVCAQMEKSAGMAAEAYAKTRAGLGVLVLSSGASGPNGLAGVAASWVDSAPLLVISGQARTDQDCDGRVRQLGNKSLNITDVARPITKYAVKVTDPTMVRYELEKAAHLALAGRPGPVWVDLPIDIQGMTIDETELKSFAPEATPSGRGPALKDQVAEAMAWLAASSRPVLLVGGGVRLSGAQGLLLELVERLGIPVLCSRRGADLVPEDHPLYFGRTGVYGHRKANFIIQNCDFLMSVGVRLAIPLVGRNTAAFARAARKVVVDIDPDELLKPTVRPDLAIAASAGEFLEELRSRLAGRSVPGFGPWIARCRGWAGLFAPLAEGYAHGTQINAYLFMDALSRHLGEDAILVADGGATMNQLMQTFRFKKGQRLISSTGLELPGFALAGAIGACVAAGRKPVACVLEDRGFHISVPELQTIREYRLPIRIFVLDNKGHSVLRDTQKAYFGARYVATDGEIRRGEPFPVGRLAAAYELPLRSIGSPAQLDEVMAEALAQQGPLLCEIAVDGAQELIPRTGFRVKEDGKWLAKPLEDMYPFLDRAVLKENMIIPLLEED